MSARDGEAAVIEARALRDSARALVRTDLATLRAEWSRRPLARRLRDRAVSRAADAIEAGVDLALAQRWVIAGTLAALAGWLFRNRLAGLVQAAWAIGVERLRHD